MATFPSSLLALVLLWQAPAPAARAAAAAPPAAADSLAVLRDRAARDSTDPRGWLALGRAYLEVGTEARGSAAGAREDSAPAPTRLDTAAAALVRAPALSGPGRPRRGEDSGPAGPRAGPPPPGRPA